MKNTLFYSILLLIAASCSTTKYNKIIEKLALTTVCPLNFKQELNIEVSEFRPIVKVKIKGQFYNFLIDTSIDGCVLDSSMVSGLAMPFISKIKNEYGEDKFVELDTVNIQNIQFSKVVCKVDDFKKYNEEYFCLPAQGVLGVNLLKKCVWQIDYFNAKLTIASHRDSLTFPKNSKTIPFFSYANNGIDVPILPLRVNGNHICNASIETASGLAMHLPVGLLKNVLDTTKHLTWMGFEYCDENNIDSNVQSKSYLLPKLNIGDYFDVQDVLVFSEKESFARISGYFLKDYICTFDWNKKQITFSPNKQIDNATFGFYLDFKNNKTYVDCLIKNTPADKAGIRLNDHIVRINDQDLSNISLQDFCNMKNPYLQDSIKISVKRNNQIVDFVLPKVDFRDLLK